MNVVNFYGYYFYETMYNTFRIALVCEYIDQKYNMEALFRRRKQQSKAWRASELEKIAASLINVLSYLQSIGVCHRDIKPANLFLLSNCEVKLIDFGESKDFFLEQDKSAEPAMATIRGTPQYLSPILWKAHVVDGNTRHAKHNIYKSDVFSTGLVLAQLAIMDDVTGFNQKNHINDGERLIERAIAGISKKHSKAFCELLRQMLKFEENERPTFVELAKTFLERPFNEDPTEPARLKKSEGDKDLVDEPTDDFDKDLSQCDALDQTWKKTEKIPEEAKDSKKSALNESKNPAVHSLVPKKHAAIVESLPDQKPEESKRSGTNEQSSEQLLTQAELFRAYAKSNDLHVNVADSVYWFEYGGNSIGEFDVNQAEGKWKIIGKYKSEFSSHFVLVFADSHGYFLLGPNIAGTCLQYKDKRLIPKQNMLQEKSFFCAVFMRGKIYTFGGYDVTEKLQLKTCEIYDIDKDHWTANPASLTQPRSQASACVMDYTKVYIFGGYNKQHGTLGTIEKYLPKEGSITLLKLTMPSPLRRFTSIKIAPNKILLLGGIQKLSKESDSVYCVDFEEQETIERLDKLPKGGVIEHPIILDSVGNLHLFIENCSGTAPPYHTNYTFLEYSQQYNVQPSNYYNYITYAIQLYAEPVNLEYDTTITVPVIP
eukprot:TRINITY_DN982_c0_g1_i1.p1 TRINITY_DN982_c0_g1~~TRINITY_DN982_c0_g1_i1.p1  ORF type:complete len:656 (-),score=70.44 TRINITY_DN982_c0_g1_i1:1173-3140(-)